MASLIAKKKGNKLYYYAVESRRIARTGCCVTCPIAGVWIHMSPCLGTNDTAERLPWERVVDDAETSRDRITPRQPAAVGKDEGMAKGTIGGKNEAAGAAVAAVVAAVTQALAG